MGTNSQTVEKARRGAKPFRTSIVPGGVYGGGARSARPVGETARSKPNEAGSAASEPVSAADDHAELRGAGARNTPRRKIPFSRAKIASLQFPRPKIRRILAETGGAHEGRAQCAKQAVVSPMSKGALQAAALQGDYCELWRVVVAGEQALPPPGAVKKPKVFSQPLAC